MQASAQLPNIHSHADIPEVAKLGKRKASDSDENTRPEKKIMMVRKYLLYHECMFEYNSTVMSLRHR